MPNVLNPLSSLNLPDTINLIVDPNNLQSITIDTEEILQAGGKKNKNMKDTSKKSTSKKSTSKKSTNKYNLINDYKKDELVKLASYFNISIQNKDGSKKKKEELFKMLKTKKIV
jgi:hypothetical protein